MTALSEQPITGLTPPGAGEALIMEVQPSIARFAVARTLAPLYALRFPLGLLFGLLTLPVPLILFGVNVFRRYAVTAQRVLVRGTLSGRLEAEVALSEIEEVRLVQQRGQGYYRAADLELVSAGRVRLRLDGVPNAESFRRRIVEARQTMAQLRPLLSRQSGAA